MTASAQSPLQCTANAGVPPLVRVEGFTELTGDLVLTCTGGNPASPFLANFQVFMNANITSRLYADNLSEALLMIDDPGLARPTYSTTDGDATFQPPFCVSPNTASNSINIRNPGIPGAAAGTLTCNTATAAGAENYQWGTYNMFRGTRGNQPGGINETLVVWTGIPVVPPGTNGTRTFRFTNIRVNATTIGTSSLIPTQVIAFVSVNPPGSLPIDNPQQIVGFVQQGMLFDVRSCSGGSQDPPNYAACTSRNRDFFNNPQRDDVFGAFASVRFREGFQTAFKTRIDTTNGTDRQAASVPGVIYNSESGFVRVVTDGNLGTVGVADSGTRLSARFVNIPAGIRMFVSTRQAAGSTGTAVLVSTDPNGVTPQFSFTTPNLGAPVEPLTRTRLSCGSETLNAVEVPLTNGAGLAVWEVTGAATSSQDTFLFTLGTAWVANQLSGIPAIGRANVIGNLAPFYSTDNAQNPGGVNAGVMSSILPIPRFAARTDTNSLFRTVECVTNLLFPYVTTWANFDTGIAISNTSDDILDSANRQTGRCTINYFGKLANGNALTTRNETTDRDVAPGDTMTFILSTGGGYGLKGNPGMQGYIIARCNFQYAHGFAFITDGPIGQARVAEGYLALVMGNGTLNRGGDAESLAH
jgi:hypothetical protein